MKKVIKVSIGNIAFTLEEDGYNLVKRYLDNISDHYYAKVRNEGHPGYCRKPQKIFKEIIKI